MSGREMLEKLGFEIIDNSNDQAIFISDYYGAKRKIVVLKYQKLIYNELIQNGNVVGAFPLTPEILEAINQYCKEMKWFD